MDYDDYPRPEPPSLAVRLMQVAGEYELGRKREVHRLESRLAEKEASLLSTQRQLDDMRENNAAMKNRVAKLEAELETVASENDSSVVALQRAVLACRFELADRLDELVQAHETLQSVQKGVDSGVVAVDGVSSANPPHESPLVSSAPHAALTALRPVLSAWSGQKLEEVRRAASGAQRWSRAALLDAVNRSDDGELLFLLSAGLGGGAAGSPLNPDAVPPTVSTALGHAITLSVAVGNVRTTKLLMSSGADVGVRSVEDGLLQTLLHVAAAGGQDGMLHMLLGKDGNGASTTRGGASPAAQAWLHIDMTDAYGRTPLHLAAVGGHSSTVEFLLRAGADPFVEDIHGHTPLTLARVGTEVYRTSKRTGQGDGPGASEGWAYAAGHLPVHPPRPRAADVLANPAIAFWNATVRANRCYNERAFKKAIAAYGVALQVAPGCGMPTTPRDLATLHYNRARAWFRLGRHCDAVEDCTAALKNDASFRNAVAQRAECHMSLFDFERAVRDFNGLLESDPTDRQWTPRLSEARAMRDMSHYGILGVRKDADSLSIKKAYRALCLRWHPDKVEAASSGSGGGVGGPGSGPEAALRANTVFRRLTEAYETLSDSYKRMIYDMDPRSSNGTPASSQAGGGGGITSGREGFEKWAGKEREREEERDRERHTELQVLSAQAGAEEKARSAARAARGKLVAAGRAGAAAAPPLSVASTPEPPAAGGRAFKAVNAAPSKAEAAVGAPPLRRAVSEGGAPSAGTTTAAPAPATTGSSAPQRRVIVEPRSETQRSTPVPASSMNDASSAPSHRGSAPREEGKAFNYTGSSAGGRASGRSSADPAPGEASGGSTGRSSVNTSTADDYLHAAAAATAARARAAVAQAEAFVRMVQQQAAGLVPPPPPPPPPAAATPSTEHAGGGEHDEPRMRVGSSALPSLDKAAVRARVQARAREYAGVGSAEADGGRVSAGSAEERSHRDGVSVPGVRPVSSFESRAAWAGLEPSAPTPVHHPFAVPPGVDEGGRGGGHARGLRPGMPIGYDGDSEEEGEVEEEGAGGRGEPRATPCDVDEEDLDGGSLHTEGEGISSTDYDVQYGGHSGEEAAGTGASTLDAEAELLARLDAAAAVAAAGAAGLELSDEELQELLDRIGASA